MAKYSESRILIPIAKPPVATSHQMAHWSGREHEAVLADIRNMFKELGEPCTEKPEYILSELNSITLASGYGYECATKVLDHFEELSRRSKAKGELSAAAYCRMRELAEADAKADLVRAFQLSAEDYPEVSRICLEAAAELGWTNP